MTSETRHLPNPEATFALGVAIGQAATGGLVVALDGPLGAGKTHLTKGIAAGLGVPPDEPVVSPTFVLMREYRGRLTLYHLDAYRLSGADELLSLGFEETLADPAGVVVLEWAERVAEAVPPDALHVRLSHAAGDTRDAVLTGPALWRGRGDPYPPADGTG